MKPIQLVVREQSPSEKLGSDLCVNDPLTPLEQVCSSNMSQ